MKLEDKLPVKKTTEPTKDSCVKILSRLVIIMGKYIFNKIAVSIIDKAIFKTSFSIHFKCKPGKYLL